VAVCVGVPVIVPEAAVPVATGVVVPEAAGIAVADITGVFNAGSVGIWWLLHPAIIAQNKINKTT
jgi:hypothetical protein